MAFIQDEEADVSGKYFLPFDSIKASTSHVETKVKDEIISEGMSNGEQEGLSALHLLSDAADAVSKSVSTINVKEEPDLFGTSTTAGTTGETVLSKNGRKKRKLKETNVSKDGKSKPPRKKKSKAATNTLKLTKSNEKKQKVKHPHANSANKLQAKKTVEKQANSGIGVKKTVERERRKSGGPGRPRKTPVKKGPNKTLTPKSSKKTITTKDQKADTKQTSPPRVIDESVGSKEIHDNSLKCDDNVSEKDDLICGECGKHLSTPITLRRHFTAMHRSTPFFRCKVCRATFFQRRDFRKHERGHKACFVCGHKVTNRLELFEHMSSHAEQLPFMCAFCAVCFPLSSQLRVHVSSLHQLTGTLHVCGKCHAIFKTGAALEQHVKEAHPPRKVALEGATYSKSMAQVISAETVAHLPYKCGKCSRGFLRSETLRGHIAGFHRINCPAERKRLFKTVSKINVKKPSKDIDGKSKSKNKPKTTCHDAPAKKQRGSKQVTPGKSETVHKSPNRVSTRKKAQKAVPSSGDLKKPYVPKRTLHKTKTSTKQKGKKQNVKVTGASKKKQHLPRVSAQKKYKCRKCSKYLGNKILRKIHMCSHRLQRKFRCKVCKKKFLHKHHLHRHVQLHADAQPYKCSACTAVLNDIWQLTDHMAAVHLPAANVPTFTCSTCEKRFLHEHSLQKHIRNHEAGRNFECDLCQMSFNTKSAKLAHRFFHEQRHICGQCSEGFGYASILRHHLAYRHERNAVCLKCGGAFSILARFHYHKAVYHKPRHICKRCKKPFFSKAALLIHKWTLCESFTNKCSVCNKLCHGRSMYRIHKKNCKKAVNKKLKQKKSGKQSKKNLSSIDENLADSTVSDSGAKSDHVVVVPKPESSTADEKVKESPDKSQVKFTDWPITQATRSIQKQSGLVTYKQFVCTLCSNKYSTRSGAVRHIKNVHLDAVQHLLVDQTAGQRNRKALSIATTPGSGPVTCSKCSKNFESDNIKEYESHFKMCHKATPENQSSSNSGNALSNDVGRATSEQASASQPSLRKKIVGSHYECKFCNSQFFSVTELHGHLKTSTSHRGEDASQCKVCGKKFLSSSIRNHHISVSGCWRTSASTRSMRERSKALQKSVQDGQGKQKKKITNFKTDTISMPSQIQELESEQQNASFFEQPPSGTILNPLLLTSHASDGGALPAPVVTGISSLEPKRRGRKTSGKHTSPQQKTKMNKEEMTSIKPGHYLLGGLSRGGSGDCSSPQKVKLNFQVNQNAQQLSEHQDKSAHAHSNLQNAEVSGLHVPGSTGDCDLNIGDVKGINPCILSKDKTETGRVCTYRKTGKMQDKAFKQKRTRTRKKKHGADYIKKAPVRYKKGAAYNSRAPNTDGDQTMYQEAEFKSCESIASVVLEYMISHVLEELGEAGEKDIVRRKLQNVLTSPKEMPLYAQPASRGIRKSGRTVRKPLDDAFVYSSQFKQGATTEVCAAINHCSTFVSRHQEMVSSIKEPTRFSTRERKRLSSQENSGHKIDNGHSFSTDQHLNTTENNYSSKRRGKPFSEEEKGPSTRDTPSKLSRRAEAQRSQTVFAPKGKVSVERKTRKNAKIYNSDTPSSQQKDVLQKPPSTRKLRSGSTSCLDSQTSPFKDTKRKYQRVTISQKSYYKPKLRSASQAVTNGQASSDRKPRLRSATKSCENNVASKQPLQSGLTNSALGTVDQNKTDGSISINHTTYASKPFSKEEKVKSIRSQQKTKEDIKKTKAAVQVPQTPGSSKTSIRRKMESNSADSKPKREYGKRCKRTTTTTCTSVQNQATQLSSAVTKSSTGAIVSGAVVKKASPCYDEVITKDVDFPKRIRREIKKPKLSEDFIYDNSVGSQTTPAELSDHVDQKTTSQASDNSVERITVTAVVHATQGASDMSPPSSRSGRTIRPKRWDNEEFVCDKALNQHMLAMVGSEPTLSLFEDISTVVEDQTNSEMESKTSSLKLKLTLKTGSSSNMPVYQVEGGSTEALVDEALAPLSPDLEDEGELVIDIDAWGKELDKLEEEEEKRSAELYNASKTTDEINGDKTSETKKPVYVSLEHDYASSSTAVEESSSGLSDSTKVDGVETRKLPEERFKCSRCFRRFSDHHRYRKHVKLHFRRPNLECDLCPAEFLSRHDLKAHRRTHQEQVWKCHECTRQFSSQKKLKRHLKEDVHAKSHRPPVETTTEDERSVSMSFPSTADQAVASIVPGGSKANICTICGAAYVTILALQGHMDSHADQAVASILPEPQKGHNCTICGANYATTQALQGHMDSHADQLAGLY